MTRNEFITAVREHVFVRALRFRNVAELGPYADTAFQQTGAWPDPAVFATDCQEKLNLVEPAVAPNGAAASPAAGARDRCIAIHEAGHAVDGVRAGIALQGIRFYGDGVPIFSYGAKE
jgi:hypothetical protein